MQFLLTFDSSGFMKHITRDDDQKMVDFIVREYGPALQYAISTFNSSVEGMVSIHYNDAYFRTVISDGNPMLDITAPKSWRKRSVDDDGNVVSTKATQTILYNPVER